ncbi:MFS transporter [Ectothiorhodospiraceae bacterium 2226]|nr:MFS transporter [Ectothiorhodospiraceae bacterium 2226]
MQNDRKQIFAWALYDWGNSAFATTVMAGFFPIFFRQYWSGEVDPALPTFHLGVANSLASVIIVALAPVLGAIADRGSAKKRFLLFFTLLGVVMTGGLYFVQAGHWQMAVALYVLATIGFSGGIIFYDSLLVAVADESRIDKVSALGYALGYLGGGLLFAVNVWMTLSPETFGLRDSAHAVQVAFVTVAVWWAVFAIPVLWLVPEPRAGGARGGRAVREGLRQLVATFREIRRLKVVFLFLVAYWLYIDGVDTIVRMAVDYGMARGFDVNSLILALLLTQFVAFPAALAFGYIGQRWGPKLGIYIALVVYIGVTIYAVFMERTAEFFVLAVAIGLVQGGIQSLSRSYYARLIPKDKAAEFFGFYNMMTKFAAVLGPISMGALALLLGDPRYAILAVLVLFVAGGTLLWFVDEEEGRRMARELERV